MANVLDKIVTGSFLNFLENRGIVQEPEKELEAEKIFGRALEVPDARTRDGQPFSYYLLTADESMAMGSKEDSNNFTTLGRDSTTKKTQSYKSLTAEMHWTAADMQEVENIVAIREPNSYQGWASVIESLKNGLGNPLRLLKGLRKSQDMCCFFGGYNQELIAYAKKNNGAVPDASVLTTKGDRNDRLDAFGVFTHPDIDRIAHTGVKFDDATDRTATILNMITTLKNVDEVIYGDTYHHVDRIIVPDHILRQANYNQYVDHVNTNGNYIAEAFAGQGIQIIGSTTLDEYRIKDAIVYYNMPNAFGCINSNYKIDGNNGDGHFNYMRSIMGCTGGFKCLMPKAIKIVTGIID